MLKLPAILSDHALFNADTPLTVWGEAAPGAEVAIIPSWCAQTTVTASQAGKWEAQLADCPASDEPQNIHFHSGNTTRILSDLLFGDLYLAGGQSNMDMPVAPLEEEGCYGVKDYQREIACATDSRLRLFHVARHAAATPQEEVKGHWLVASPSIGAFPALPYFFGQACRRQTGRPVGVMVNAWGGTSINFWLSQEELQKNPNCHHLLPQIPIFEKFRLHASDAESSAAEYRRHYPLISPDFDLARRMPAGGFLGMTHPLRRCRFRGWIWFQGEGDAQESVLYPEKFTALIRSYRKLFNQPALPLVFAQLSGRGDGEKQSYQCDSDWAKLRHAQNSALTLPHCSIAPMWDLGTNDIHFPDKRTAGERMALQMMEHRNPLPIGVSQQDDQILIQFASPLRPEPAVRGLSVSGGELRQGVASGSQLILTVQGNVQSVCFAWADNPDANLFFADGFPVAAHHLVTKP